MEELCKNSVEEGEWEDLKPTKHHVQDPNIVKTKDNPGTLKDKCKKPRHCEKCKKIGHTIQKCPKFVKIHNASIHIEDSIKEMVYSNSSLNLLIIHFIFIFIRLNWLKEKIDFFHDNIWGHAFITKSQHGRSIKTWDKWVYSKCKSNIFFIKFYYDVQNILYESNWKIKSYYMKQLTHFKMVEKQAYMIHGLGYIHQISLQTKQES